MRVSIGSSFDFKEALERVRIDVSRSHIWDLTGVATLDAVVLKFRREGTEVEIIGLNEASATSSARSPCMTSALERLTAH